MTPDGVLLDEPAELARLTGMHVRYAAVHAFALVEPENGRAIGAATWGNAWLTRWPLRDGFALGLPVGADEAEVEPAGSGRPLAGVTFAAAPYGTREPRCAVGGRLAPASATAPAPSAWLVNTHLTYAGTGQRQAQAERLARMADDLGSPVILAGDLNAPIEAPELRPLADAFDDAFAAVGVPPGDPRRRSCGPHRIDHLLTRGLRALECVVVHGAGDASDHLPVVATFAATS